MKKALALVLALVLALSLGVSAFAATLDLVGLKPDAPEKATKIKLNSIDDNGTGIYLVPNAKGGDFYFEIEDSDLLKDLEVVAKGAISAEIVKYDSDKMEDYGSAKWHLVKNGEVYTDADITANADELAIWNELVLSGKYDTAKDGYRLVYADGTKSGKLDEAVAKRFDAYKESFKLSNKEIVKKYIDNYNAGQETIELDANTVSYEDNMVFEYSEAFYKDLARELNDLHHTSKFEAVNGKEGTKLLKVTVNANYSAHYTVGEFKVTARKLVSDRKYTNVAYEGIVINDVSVFEVNEVKWAGKTENALVVDDPGYSDFLIDVEEGRYSDEKVYVEEALRDADYKATVVSTTAFRALREAKDGLEVEAGRLYVTIPEIASSQKGVNFMYKEVQYNKKANAVEFGFYGDQTIASNFTVEADLDMTAWTLRETFGERMEEEDVITYYVVENGNVAGKFTVDYLNDEVYENLVIEIERAAGSTLGMYKIVTEAPAATENKGEENPNTGAESVLGVVAAMAVVSVAAAAAVSLKK